MNNSTVNIKTLPASTRFWASLGLYAWLVVSVLVTLVPLAWMIWASLSKGKLLTGVTLLPNLETFSLEHYQYLFTYSSTLKEGAISDFVAAFLRTLLVAVLNVGLVVVLSTMVGYAVSRFRFKGKKTVMYSMLVLQLFPAFMGMVALTVIFVDFGWLRNPNYLVFIYAAGSIPLNVFMMRGYFQSIPTSFDEAAMIDGASKTRTFFSILLPLTTLTYNPLNFMAGGLLLGLPIMLVQFYMQRFVVYGLSAGGDKS